MLKPLGDRVVLEAQEEEEQTVGGIVLASNAQEKPQTAKVVAVGKGTLLESGKEIAPDVKIGDTVLFDKYAGTDVKDGDKSYLVVHGKDIIAIVE
ncbi:co-chaperone GroES [Secundilactobacillus malefermentans]|uniref:Co-chaperonin GroES n=1 Tax=Secundilactobacillus malefermentans TaxID=176292 RepID=A0A4R5NRV1_9LACO|nr:co-chaperone GroES [Secundilactobacillus malefermentans]KRM55921.1 Co-chaperonin GroES (HSP10) [Secundilactobacillus malefermentans DSM 5705 = KCTC 3548]QEA32034.1 co-chaperone GroES [Secundilactobacillus malefermentans]TDG79620.1 hypothetical protein C5L31_001157 [Secundilactobacillus malefermentans]